MIFMVSPGMIVFVSAGMSVRFTMISVSVGRMSPVKETQPEEIQKSREVFGYGKIHVHGRQNYK